MESGSFISAQQKVYVLEQAIRAQRGGLRREDKEIKPAFSTAMEIKPLNTPFKQHFHQPDWVEEQ